MPAPAPNPVLGDAMPVESGFAQRPVLSGRNVGSNGTGVTKLVSRDAMPVESGFAQRPSHRDGMLVETQTASRNSSRRDEMSVKLTPCPTPNSLRVALWRFHQPRHQPIESVTGISLVRKVDI